MQAGREREIGSDQRSAWLKRKKEKKTGLAVSEGCPCPHQEEELGLLGWVVAASSHPHIKAQHIWALSKMTECSLSSLECPDEMAGLPVAPTPPEGASCFQVQTHRKGSPARLECGRLLMETEVPGLCLFLHPAEALPENDCRGPQEKVLWSGQ